MLFTHKNIKHFNKEGINVMKFVARLATSLFATSAMLLQALPVQANTPGSVRDLVGARAAGGESTIQERGFTLIRGDTKYGRKVNYWWNPNTKECVRVTVFDGTFSSIDQTSNTDCNQKSGKDNTGIAVAAGAAALIALAALASKSHHNKETQQSAEFDRGYRDGQRNESYQNYNRNDDYGRGYEKGARERGNQPNYSSGNRRDGGYDGQVDINDLVGKSRSAGTGQLVGRGFVMRDNKQVNDGRYMTFWRQASRQCLVVQSQDQVIISVENVSESTCSN
ncbi:hypothetical protein [Novosphingobium sp. FKTRR1]|uniref:hypothetical protein n=1 Tax=Novosphingobium sp. FKTRR1 TaxID=2879118 RepID=UPI001CF06F7B|nr:hypothetical protein [Novosphingobium sp. FKTRR1]